MYQIMIVDDSSIIRRGLCLFFEKENLGFNVCASFCDGKDAIQYLTQNSFEVDVVLTDIKMHDVTGLDIAEFIKKHDLNIPVVLLSAYQEFDFAQRAISANVYRYLLKPVKFDKLKELFLEIRTNLDSMKKEKLLELFKSYNFEWFINRLSSGAYESRDKVLEDIDDMNLPTALLDFPCCFVAVDVGKDDFYIKERIVKAINNILYYNDLFGCRILVNGDSCYILAVPTSAELCRNFALFQEHMQEVLTGKFNEIFELSGVDVEFLFKQSFESLWDMALYFFQSNEKIIIEQLKQLILMEAISHNVKNAKRCLKVLTDKLRNMDEHYVVNFLKDFNISMDEYFGKDDGAEFTEGDFYGQFKQLEKELIDAARKDTDYQTSVMKKALDFLEENYTKDICIADVAKHVYLNPVYFGRIFKMKMEETFTDYLIKKRIALAKELLKNEKSVSETAIAVGYTNVQYFIRIFKKNTGFTPGEFKRLGETEI